MNSAARSLLINLGFLLLVSNPAISFAQISTPDKELVLSADTMKRTSEKIFLIGNVQAVVKGNSLSCDQATVHIAEKKIVAVGNIKLVGPEVYIEGDQLDLNYEDMTGDIVNGFAKMGQITFSGELIRKTGKKTYEVAKGNYTACSTCPPAWSFSGSEIEAEVGGYAHIKNSLIRVVDVPVFWLPYMLVPLKSDRQTGFLFPEFGFGSTNGVTISESFFWAIEDNQDATFTVRHYQNRGYKGLLNYRYLLSEHSGGQLDMGYISDSKAATENRIDGRARPESQGPLKRSFLKYRQHYELPSNFTSDIDINHVSDALYPKDFPKEIDGHGDAALENRASLSKNGEIYHLSMDNSYYYTLLQENAVSDNRESVHRLPEINYSLTPIRIANTPLFTDMYANYVSFYREDELFDDNGGDTNFQPEEGDLYRTGQRMIFRPRISAPFSLAKKIDFVPSVAYEEFRYEFGYGEKPSTERRLLRNQIEANTRFSTIFEGSGGSRYRHEFQPILRYSNLLWEQQDDHPFFPETDEDPFYRRNQNLIDDDADSGLLQFDYKDRVVDRNILTYAVNNTITAKRKVGSRTHYDRIFRFQVAQSYDFYEAQRTDIVDVRPWSEVETLIDIKISGFTSFNTIRYYPYQNEALVSSRSRISGDRGEFLELNYSQDFNLKSNAILTQRTEDLITRAGFYLSSYLRISGNLEYSFVQDDLRSYGSKAQIKAPGNCWGIVLSYDQEIDSESNFGVNFLFLFDGKTETEI